MWRVCGSSRMRRIQCHYYVKMTIRKVTIRKVTVILCCFYRECLEKWVIPHQVMAHFSGIQRIKSNSTLIRGCQNIKFSIQKMIYVTLWWTPHTPLKAWRNMWPDVILLSCLNIFIVTCVLLIEWNHNSQNQNAPAKDCTILHACCSCWCKIRKSAWEQDSNSSFIKKCRN